MDEKAAINPPVSGGDTIRPNSMRSARRARIAAALLIGLIVVYYTCYQRFAVPTSDLAAYSNVRNVDDYPLPGSAAALVPLEAHIMSKCPDARDAMRELILPVMQRVSDKVDFRLTYIGKATADDGVDCLHGPSECMGNIIELCARELYPDPKISLGFVMCLSKDYKHIPERGLVEDCALEHAIDFDALNECVTRDDGAHGIELLRTSVERTAKVRIHTHHC
ncbi:hypothetical protein ACO1O0_004199 [Amphichorda felina]